MSQWGDSKEFENDKVKIKVLSHWETDSCFAPITKTSRLDKLVLMGFERGTREDADALFAEVCARNVK